MKIVTVTSDHYRDLLGPGAKLFNYHWSEKIEVVAFCYKPPNCSLPSNFVVSSIGKKSIRDWTTSLRDAIKEIDSETILFYLEDHFLVEDVDQALIDDAEDLLKSGEVDKVWMGGWNTSQLTHRKNMKDFVHFKGDYDLMLSSFPYEFCQNLSPSIWRREMLLDLLMPGLSITECEEKSRLSSDQWRVVYNREHVLFPGVDVTSRGKFNCSSIHIEGDSVKVLLTVPKRWVRLGKMHVDVFREAMSSFPAG